MNLLIPIQVSIRRSPRLPGKGTVQLPVRNEPHDGNVGILKMVFVPTVSKRFDQMVGTGRSNIQFGEQQLHRDFSNYVISAGIMPCHMALPPFGVDIDQSL